MELILRVRTSAHEPADVVVDVETTHGIDELAYALACHLRLVERSPILTLTRTGRALDPGITFGDSGIVSGDEVTIGCVDRPPVPPAPKRAVSADVLAGPDAGASTTLHPGSYVFGRSPDCDVVLPDPTVSRMHLDVVVSDHWEVTVSPRGDAVNAATVNDCPVDEPLVVGDHDVIALGGTRLAFRRYVRADTERLDHLGQIAFQRTPYRPPVVAERAATELGKIPEPRQGRRFQVLSAIAPLAGGLTFFAFSRQPQFLVMTGISPVVMVANYFEDKRTGRRKFEEESELFEQRVVEWRSELDDLLQAERVDRLRAAPDLADLARRAELRTVDLWARGRGAPDFLQLRVGLGESPSKLTTVVPAGGAEHLRAQVDAALEGTDRLGDTPLTIDLARDGVFGIHGPAELVNGAASSMVVQASCLHSPEDLVIAAAVGPSQPMSDWLKWLPHLRSVSSPLAGDHLATTHEECASLVDRLLEVAEFRISEGSRSPDTRGNVDRRWPWILAVIDTELEPDPANVAKLLDLCPSAGISVLWLAGTAADVPRQAVEVLATEFGIADALIGRIWSTDPGVVDREVEVEQIKSSTADRVARALAPIRDASTASLASAIPRTAPLLDVLEVGSPTAEWVADKWATSRGYGLEFPIGMGANGPLTIDLVEDGPHTLIGGTSGAGKSELMQSIVGALAVNHPPQRLNFLFVDYKGGASSNVFGVLPHTVGYVTNLSAELSLRALTSLRAELNRRMQVMEGKAKDLEEMLELHPADAPPSLVIIVDEFATLVKEVPEFVAGIVDIAQRGRSLGIHLILATQRPSGSVNDNILANTNLRISLRMLDRTESTSVIGSPEAGDIPVPLKGRAYARLGPRTLTAFQSAFCGAPLTTEEVESPILVAAFDRPSASPKAVGTSGPSESDGTHLDAVLAAIGEAAQNLNVPAPRKPWREVLPEVITLISVLQDQRSAPAHESPGRMIAVGMIDAPERQDQAPAIVDLEEGGGWLIFGSGGSGKTTVLRTIAVSAAATARPDQVEIFGFDFASRGLASIAPLPHVVDVATGDDLEAVTRHLATLSAEMQRRRQLLAAANSEHLTAYNEGHDPLSRIIVLIDGFGGFQAQFVSGPSGGQASLAMPLDRWAEVVSDLVVEGRQVGIHVVLTADRRAVVPSRLHSSVSNRLIMRHADSGGYSEHGVPSERAKGLDLAPGRGLWQADSVVQIASVTPDPTGRSQVDAIQRMAAAMEPAEPSPLATAVLPDNLGLGDIGPIPEEDSGPMKFPLGIVDRSRRPAMVDLTWSNFLVVGSARSGRSTTLSTCAAGLARDHSVWGMGPSSSMIDRSLLDEAAFGRADVIAPLIERLTTLHEVGPPKRPIVVLIDDLDTFDDASLNAAWQALDNLDDVRVVASMETRSLVGYTTNPLLQSLRRARRMLFLQPDDPSDVLQGAGVKPPIRPGQRLSPGRGVFISDRVPSIVQVARRVIGD